MGIVYLDDREGMQSEFGEQSSHDFHIQVAIWGSLESKEKPE
jgi:hypothetical protein